MKKSDLYCGLGYTLFGIACIAAALLLEFRAEAALWGLGGAGLGPGITMIVKYVYWSKPSNKARYEQRLKEEKIEMSDERKVMLRDKSGCITYRLIMLLHCIFMFVFSIMSVLDFLNPFSKYACIGLACLLVFQYICGLFIFRYLDKRL